jgi:hypothetical protein
MGLLMGISPLGWKGGRRGYITTRMVTHTLHRHRHTHANTHTHRHIDTHSLTRMHNTTHTYVRVDVVQSCLETGTIVCGYVETRP